MKLRISESAARPAFLIAASARVFLGLAVDAPTTHNGAWLCALLGALPAAVWVLCMRITRPQQSALRRPVQKALALALLAIALADAATVLSAVARSAGFLALDRISPVWLSLPVCLIALWSLRNNGDAIGYGAMVALRAFGALALLVVLLQARHYRPDWLSPLLGDGTRNVLEGALKSAGWYLAPSALLFLSEPSDKRDRPNKWLATLLGSAGLAALALILRQMMTPAPLSPQNWFNRLDTLLTNGRAPLYLQLPMISLWYMSLIHICVCDCFVAATLFQRLLPTASGLPCALSAVLISALLTAVGFPGSTFEATLGRWQFIAAATFAGLAALTCSKSEGGDRTCASFK